MASAVEGIGSMEAGDANGMIRKCPSIQTNLIYVQRRKDSQELIGAT